MAGEGFALLAALAYGLAGVTIVKSKATARGDNGVFLSVVLTAVISGLMWLSWGQVSVARLMSADAAQPLAVFAAAGFFSMVLGRTLMYRATEQIGPVAASLLRRLTPVFALPIGVLVLAEVLELHTFFGAILVISAVVIYIGKPAQISSHAVRVGWLLGAGSAAFYAVSYVLRSHGLDHLPDAALGTFIGAVAGLLWMLGACLAGAHPLVKLQKLVLDRGRWHWLTAAALSAGQIFQFFALKSTSVVVVATLGSLEVLFSALLGGALIGGNRDPSGRIWLPICVAAAGTALLVW